MNPDYTNPPEYHLFEVDSVEKFEDWLWVELAELVWEYREWIPPRFFPENFQ